VTDDSAAASIVLRPIGVLRTPFATRADCPRNGRQPNPAPQCQAHIHAEFVAGLQDLGGFSHLILLYWLDRVRETGLRMTPPFDGQPRGVFATRAPARPNPIGLSVVAFDGFAAPDRLLVRFLDCIDGTMLIDIKPYLPSTDAEPSASMGWLARHATPRPADDSAPCLTAAPGLRDMPG
jgi:tRNA-Thr(GGU) m(6)t(6)A37 methyltransferase TsaA